LRASARICLAAFPPSRPANSRSTSARCSRDRHAVSRTSNVAAYSEISPAHNAANVCGISTTRACENPTNRDPQYGDSRRASAISDPIPRARSRTGTPANRRASRRDSLNATVNRACAAAAAAFNVSNTAIRSINAASPPSGGSSRNAATTRSSSPVDGPTTAPSEVSHIQANIRPATDSFDGLTR
jgi:hypothetical protein